MSRFEFDIDLYENRDFNITIEWYDEDDNLIDITGYGAILVIKKNIRTQEEAIRATHESEITVGTTNGKFTINVLKDDVNLDFSRGIWEMIIFPDSESPVDNPISFAGGVAKYHKTPGSLT